MHSLNEPVGHIESRLLLLLLPILLLASATIAAQERPFDVSPCEILARPDMYREALVRVEGYLVISPNDFTIHGNCDDSHGKIWVEFGGGEPNPAVPRNREQFVHYKEEVTAVPLNKDRDYNLLLQRLTEAAKRGKPQMLRVTLSGRYFPGNPVRSGNVLSTQRGYGPNGCCSLLVIAEVDPVTSSLEQPADFSSGPDPGTSPTAKGCTVTDLPVATREQAEEFQRQTLDEGFDYLHSPETSAAHFLAQAVGLKTEIPPSSLQATHLGPEAAWQSSVWRLPGELGFYTVIVNKPFWLLPLAHNGDSVVWLPKRISHTVCGTPAKRK